MNTLRFSHSSWMNTILSTEAVVRRCSVEKEGLQLYEKRDSGTGVFLLILRAEHLHSVGCFR